jgi:AcrR family transcriptional regulator
MKAGLMPRGEFDRTPRKARTRAALLEAAARVYARRGFDGATIDEVAEEAGFTKGAVYSHFGSKENLLVALLDEHLAAEIAEQMALFDPAQDRWEWPRTGADRWMAELERDPDPFRLFVELWVHAQRDEVLRERLVSGLGAWRAMVAGFADRRAQAAGLEPAGEASTRWADVAIGLGVGLGMVELIDRESVAPGLLGEVLSVLLGAREDSGAAELLGRREELGAAELSGAREASGAAEFPRGERTAG